MLRTSAGRVEIESVYGQDTSSGQWLCPLREALGLDARQEMSPFLEERLCFTATLTGSFESAAQVACHWGAQVDDSTIHRRVTEAGIRAQKLHNERIEKALNPDTRGRVVEEAHKELGRRKITLVIEMDGWMVRERGSQWAMKPPEAPGARVQWHEMKTGVIFRLDQRAQSQTRRRIIVEKYLVAHRGDPSEFGRAVHAQALRRGLAQAAQVFVISDGAVWIWNIVGDRFGQASGGLDFYHASQHLWAVAKEMCGADEQGAKAWVEPLLSQLRHGGHKRVIETLDQLLQPQGPSNQVIAREVNYFHDHADHIDYQSMETQGYPLGSGAVESACAQLQGRFKRPGQFWTTRGLTHLLEIEIARRNGEWNSIWSKNPERN